MHGMRTTFRKGLQLVDLFRVSILLWHPIILEFSFIKIRRARSPSPFKSSPSRSSLEVVDLVRVTRVFCPRLLRQGNTR
jgi:hypothetical protein